jgi:S-sulfosulfanyl-L-cysteine sulfohydrolase
MAMPVHEVLPSKPRKRSCKRFRRLSVALAIVLGALMTPAVGAEVTFIHMGDVHGHLMPRPSLSGKTSASTEGGLARMFTAIDDIRKRRGKSKTLLVNTGDSIQGSAEALFTRGQAVVDVLNRFGIDAYAPGNWDWVYGVERTLELFGGSEPKAPWNALAANAYYDGEPYADRSGSRVLNPYLIREVDGVKIGIIGFTTDRGPQVVGRAVTRGVRFTKGDQELKELVALLREREQVALVIVISELGLSNNIRLAEQTPGINAILSSDMHEITSKPVVTGNNTIISEVGQDGQVIGELTLTVEGGRVANWKWTQHRIDDRVTPNRRIATLIAQIRKPFLAGKDFRPQINPFNKTTLLRPIDTVVGRTEVALHRMNVSTRNPAAVIEGSSHILLTDAFRHETGADVAAIRGFRYGTVVQPGPIKLEDLYHFIPIGPLIAKGTIKGQQLRNQLENSIDGSLNPDVSKWTGGWLFNFSGLRADIDPYAKQGERASNIRVFDRASKDWKPLDTAADYTYASYYYARDPDLINTVPAGAISVLKDTDGEPLDGVDVVARYLAGLPRNTTAPRTGRLKLLKPLPVASFGSEEIQPWRGATRPAPAGAGTVARPSPMPAGQNLSSEGRSR